MKYYFDSVINSSETLIIPRNDHFSATMKMDITMKVH